MSGERVGIVGLGLIGGSIGLRAAAAGMSVSGYDGDPAVAVRALERGAVGACVPDLPTLAGSSEILIIALPLDATAAVLAGLVGRTGPGLVLDVASVKVPLAPYAARLPAYVGTHPMAGRERGGIEFADGNLFEHATWTHVPHRDPSRRASARAFIRAMGARPYEIDAVAHDALVALTSHLPQALSVVLAAELNAGVDRDERVLDLCGPGMTSMLRLARSPVDLWSPIFEANAEPLAAHLRSVAQRIVAIADGLDRGDSTRLVSYFEVALGVSTSLAARSPATRDSRGPTAG